jgi:hypothetical protein
MAPKLVKSLVPVNGAEQKALFLDGAIANPDHRYDLLESTDFAADQAGLEHKGSELLSNPDLNPKHVTSYAEFVDRYHKTSRSLELANAYNQATDPAEKAAHRDAYMALNIELYGEPDESTYRSLLHDKLKKVEAKELRGDAAAIRDELFAMTDFDSTTESIPRFRPSDETVSWMHDIAMELYGDMLAHVPRQESYTVQDIAGVFTTILAEEFGGSADGWEVVIEKAQSIAVKANEKRIVIPEDRTDPGKRPVDYEYLCDLVVHEIGVHALRSIMGEQTDLDPLRTGLSNYGDSEEGLGLIMEQARKGMYKEDGVNYYITAGAAYFDNKDFRGLFEQNWRMKALESLKDGAELTDAAILKAKNEAYNGVMRIMRGTDELPLFKDLSYYNGSSRMWQHLESIRGDDLKFSFVLMGKADASNTAHERIMYETRSV